ncbi:hypothetical protein L6452_19356 [Arctium lappa]|uniref:Uncharacterized protein n=1 Tax=Arctium lappa TaxID=4217 RepID=A0ACB9B8W6_ARCLA|nr:hypothetical protein L6452_19356 [Arctium lappa]
MMHQWLSLLLEPDLSLQRTYFGIIVVTSVTTPLVTFLDLAGPSMAEDVKKIVLALDNLTDEFGLLKSKMFRLSSPLRVKRCIGFVSSSTTSSSSSSIIHTFISHYHGVPLRLCGTPEAAQCSSARDALIMPLSSSMPAELIMPLSLVVEASAPKIRNAQASFYTLNVEFLIEDVDDQDEDEDEMRKMMMMLLDDGPTVIRHLDDDDGDDDDDFVNKKI